MWYQSGSNSFYQYSLFLHNFLRMELSNVELFGDSSSCCGSWGITWLVGFGCSFHMVWRRNLLVGYGVGMDVLMGVVFCCCGGVEDGQKKLRNSIFSPCFGCRGYQQQPTAHQNRSFLSLAWKVPVSADQSKLLTCFIMSVVSDKTMSHL